MTRELTEEQKAKIPAYVDKWTAVALSAYNPETAATDEELMDLVAKVYESAGVAAPEFFCRVDSPYVACEHLTSIGASTQHGWGTGDAAWLATYDFDRNECGKVEETEKVMPLLEFSKRVGFWFPFEKSVIVCNPPTEIHQDERDRLHNPNGMAIKFNDGRGEYYLNGVNVPDWLVNTPAEDLDATQILELKNDQQRTEGLKKIGTERAIKALNPRVLNRKSYVMENALYADFNKMLGLVPKTDAISELEYELLGVDFPLGERIYLKMTNPSTAETHIESVHPECTTVDQAIAWRKGDENFQNLQEFEFPAIIT